MRKGNWIVTALFVVVSAFLLWLWYYLAFDHVDAPLDLVISIVWWVGIAAIVWLIHRSEDKRRREVRTIYVSRDALYNNELGVVECADPERRVPLMAEMLERLKYGYDSEEMPEREDFDCRYVVETTEFDPKDKEEGDRRAPAAEDEPYEPEVKTWKGTITRIVRVDGRQRNESRDFGDERELLCALV